MKRLLLAATAALICGALGAAASNIPYIAGPIDAGNFLFAINGLIQTLNTQLFIGTSYTVATLPTCNSTTNGNLTRVTDATTPTYNGTLTGGSNVIVPVFCNGTAWTSH